MVPLAKLCDKIINRRELQTMKLVKLYLLRLLAGMLPIILIACSPSNSGDGEVSSDVVVEFAARVNGADFNCGQTYTGVGSGGHDFVVNDFRMYVHDASIRDPASANEYPIDLIQDGVWQLDDLVLLDFEDGCATGTAEINRSTSGAGHGPDGDRYESAQSLLHGGRSSRQEPPRFGHGGFSAQCLRPALGMESRA